MMRMDWSEFDPRPSLPGMKKLAFWEKQLADLEVWIAKAERHRPVLSRPELLEYLREDGRVCLNDLKAHARHIRHQLRKPRMTRLAEEHAIPGRDMTRGGGRLSRRRR